MSGQQVSKRKKGYTTRRQRAQSWKEMRERMNRQRAEIRLHEQEICEMTKRKNSVRKVLHVQALPGNYDYDKYMLGLYNGLELAMALLENREPVYRSLPKLNILQRAEKWLDKLLDKKLPETWWERK